MTKICKIGGGGLFSWGGGVLFYRGLLTMDENKAYHVSLSVNLSGKSKTKLVWSFFPQFKKYHYHYLIKKTVYIVPNIMSEIVDDEM